MSREAAGSELPAELSAAAQAWVAALRAAGHHEASWRLPGAELHLRLLDEGDVLPLHEQGPGAVVVRAPVAGRFYHAQAPGLAPAVAVGAQVAQGAPLGYMEAMKLIHPLLSPRGGWVRQLAVADGAAVVVGQKLVVLSPEAPEKSAP